MPACIIGRCENEAAVRMSLTSFGQTREADFCERCARDFEPCWKLLDDQGRAAVIDGTAQLQLEIA